MRDVIYVGPANLRVLGEADFAKMGIEHKHDIEFQRGIKQEVSNSMADSLLSHHLIIGEFIELPEDEEVLVVEPDTSAIVNDANITSQTGPDDDSGESDSGDDEDTTDETSDESADESAPAPKQKRSRASS